MPVSQVLFGLLKKINTSLLAVCFASANPGWAALPTPLCASATALPVVGELHGFGGEQDSVQWFRLELPSAGLVTLDLITEGESENLAEVDILEAGCDETAEATVVEQTSSHLVLAVRGPGTWFFHASASPPGRSLGLYRIDTSFVAARVVEETWVARPESLSHTSADRIEVARFYAARVADKSELIEVDPDPGLTLPPGTSFSIMTSASGASQGFGLLATIVTLRLSRSAVFEQLVFYH